MLICTFQTFESGNVLSICSSNLPFTFRHAFALSETVGKGIAAFPYALNCAPTRLTPLCCHVVKCLWDTARPLRTMSYNLCDFQKYSKAYIRYLRTLRSNQINFKTGKLFLMPHNSSLAVFAYSFLQICHATPLEPIFIFT